ncbi:hypothetical protein, partial [Pseudomonas guariconensis]|uniref:hypothetical protein n=1 Tax=Pseudomonas guariconensis TaxID=1288410 RepID=UPI001E48394A
MKFFRLAAPFAGMPVPAKSRDKPAPTGSSITLWEILWLWASLFSCFGDVFALVFQQGECDSG